MNLEFVSYARKESPLGIHEKAFKADIIWG